MTKYRVVLLLALFSAAGCAAEDDTAGAAEERRAPNIVVILADDAGYADFGFQGSIDVLTPNIDAIAGNGVTYTNAYVTTPFCSPSRAGILTGRYPQRYGYEFNLTHEPPPGVDAEFMGLAVEEKTLGDYLQAAGYATIAVGKWHVGDAPQFHPNARGFDHFYGFLGGGSSYHPALQKPGTMRRDVDSTEATEYLTDDLAREAVAYIEQYQDQPFLLYLAFNAVHTPMDVLQTDMQRFAHVEDEHRRRLMAMTWAMDRAVGNVMTALEGRGLLENTLLIFTNDNGGDRIGIAADNAPLRGTKGTLLEGGVRVPLVMQWPDVIAAGSKTDGMVSLMDIVPTAIAVAGGEPPDNLDGRSLLSGDGALAEGHEALFWRYDVMAAVRRGDWKLLRFPDRPPQLYDLSADIAESKDLAAQNPETVGELMRQLFAWEAGMIHARWNTGTFWSQEDVRRYDSDYVAGERTKTAAAISGEVR